MPPQGRLVWMWLIGAFKESNGCVYQHRDKISNAIEPEDSGIGTSKGIATETIQVPWS